MARRKDHTREQLKQLAIESAKSQISKNGFRDFSVRNVAKEIGYTVGTLYQVFNDVDDLIIHLNANTLDEINEYMQARINDKSNKILELSLAYFEFAEENINLWQILFDYKLSPKNSLPDWYLEKLRKPFLLTESLLSNEKFKNNGKSKISIQERAISIWSSIHGVTVLYLSGKMKIINKEANPKELIKDIINNIIN